MLQPPVCRRFVQHVEDAAPVVYGPVRPYEPKIKAQKYVFNIPFSGMTITVYAVKHTRSRYCSLQS